MGKCGVTAFLPPYSSVSLQPRQKVRYTYMFIHIEVNNFIYTLQFTSQSFSKCLNVLLNQGDYILLKSFPIFGYIVL